MVLLEIIVQIHSGLEAIQAVPLEAEAEVREVEEVGSLEEGEEERQTLLEEQEQALVVEISEPSRRHRKAPIPYFNEAGCNG